MADNGGRGSSGGPLDTSCVLIRRDYLEMLAAPVFERFDVYDERTVIIDAVASRGIDQARDDDEDEEMIRKEVVEHLFPRWARDLGVDVAVARHGLARFRARLERLPSSSPLKRVFHTLGIMQRCATRAQLRHAVSCSAAALAMERGNVDTTKGRALDHCRAGTLFEQVRRADLADIHLFVLTPTPALRAAAKPVLSIYCTPSGNERASSMMDAHQEQNRRRRIRDVRLKEARKIWESDFAAALDGSMTRPSDVEAWFARAGGARGPGDIRKLVELRWQDLRVHRALPARGVGPDTTFASILGRSDRPPTGVLEGPWARVVHGRGPRLASTFQSLVDAARRADRARDLFNEASENAYLATQARPPELKDAILNFNRSLDEALTLPSEVRMSK